MLVNMDDAALATIVFALVLCYNELEVDFEVSCGKMVWEQLLEAYYGGSHEVHSELRDSGYVPFLSHGELIRDGYDETLTVDPDNLRFIFQGMWDKDKSGKGYGQFQWRIGMLTPVASE